MTATLLSSSRFPPTRAAGLQRLADFLPHAGARYAARRNTDYGPDKPASVSRLSPYLRYRLISEDETVRAVLQNHSFETAEKFIQEVLWRTYWKGWLEMRPSVWQAYQRDHLVLREIHQHDPLLQAAELGETGIEGFDEWAKELVQTGYLHNHARMWFASIWIFTLKLPWVLGAAFFLRHLLDADAASNTLSWRWVAGLQTPGKTYLATTENIARFTDGRFVPQGLALQAEALVEPPLAAPKLLRTLKSFDPQASTLLLVHPEDLHPEAMLPRDENIKAIAFANDRRFFWGDNAYRFIASCEGDIKERIERHYGLQPLSISMDEVDKVTEYAKSKDIKQIIAPFAPQGLISAWLGSLESIFNQADVTLLLYRRHWDEAFWPYATKGFFPFKENIPSLLRARGIL